MVQGRERKKRDLFDNKKKKRSDEESKPLSMRSRHLSLKKTNWSTCTSSEKVVAPGVAVDPAMAKLTPWE